MLSTAEAEETLTVRYTYLTKLTSSAKCVHEIDIFGEILNYIFFLQLKKSMKRFQSHNFWCWYRVPTEVPAVVPGAKFGTGSGTRCQLRYRQ